MVMLPFSGSTTNTASRNRSEIPFVLIGLRIQAILHQSRLNARHPQLLLGIIQQLLSYLLALIQPGQLLLNTGDLILDGGDLGTNDLDLINLWLQDRNIQLQLGNLLYGPQQRLDQVALLYLPLQFVENVPYTSRLVSALTPCIPWKGPLSSLPLTKRAQ